MNTTTNPVSRSRYAGQRWKRSTSYSFAAGDAWSELTVQELPQAMLHLPIGFVAVQDRFVPAALQGVAAGKNLFVARDGRWLGGYIPAVYRAYPFALASNERGEQVLCFNEGSGLLSSHEGELFYDDQNQPGKALAELVNFMQAMAAGRQFTQQVCAVLQKHSLIQPWPITVPGDGGATTLATGMFRIDEAALNQLGMDALLELRNAGALLPAYCQLLSTQHVPMLFKLADAHAQAQAMAAAPVPVKGKELDLSFLEGRETLRFS